MANPRCLRRKDKLLALFEKHGIRPRTRMGQNFLLDTNQVHFIVRAGKIEPGDLVLEVGCGTGFLTRELLATGARVVGVEYDRKLGDLLESEFADNKGFTLLRGDILEKKTKINPQVLETLRQMMAETPQAGLKCVSNLPYSAGTPFVANMFETDLPWDLGVFLLQYEVGQRLTAGPGTGEYGPLAIRAALGGAAHIRRKVPPQVFWPRPKVDSAVIAIEFAPWEARKEIAWTPLRQVAQAAFGGRRKRLRNAVKGVMEQATVDAFLQARGLPEDIRGEQLTPEMFLSLAELAEETS